VAPLDRETFDLLAAPLERELEGLLDAARASALCCRLALLHWDLLGDLEAAERWLRRAEPGHELPAELMREVLLARGSYLQAATHLEAHAESGAPAPERASTILIEASLIRLFCLGDLAGAHQTSLRASAVGGAGQRRDRELSDLIELTALCADDYRALVARASSAEAPTSTLLLAAASLWDLEHDLERSAELLRRARALDHEDLLALELSLEVACCQPDSEELIALLEQKHAILSRQEREGAEARALAVELARRMGALGRHQEAAALLDRVDPPIDELETTNPLQVSPLGWAEAMLLWARREVAARAGDLRQLGRVYLGLAEATRLPALARVYRLRAAQIHTHAGAETLAIDTLLRRNLEENRADLHSARALEAIRLRTGATEALFVQYEESADTIAELRPLTLRKAALLAEARLGDPAAAAALRRDGLGLASDASGQGDLRRLFRAMSSEARLVESYRFEAEAGDPERAALALSVLAALRLKLGQIEEAELSANAALMQEPADPLALAVLSVVYRQEKRDLDLRALLQRQADSLTAPTTRATALLELARLLRNAESAHELLVQAHALQPDDLDVSEELGTSCERLGRSEEAVRHYARVAERLQHDPVRGARIYLRLGQLRDELGATPQALEAYTRCLELDPTSREALLGLAAIQRARGDLVALLEVLHRLQQLEHAPELRASLQLEVARVMERVGRSPAELIEAYTRSVRAEPTRAEALRDLERICRAEGRVEVLARVLAELPPSRAELELLARLLEELGDREALADVLAILVTHATGPLERADRRYELGRLLEALGREKSAIEQYEDALGEMAGHQPALRALERIYRSDGRVSALVRVLERELVTTSDGVRQAEILADLARSLEEAGHGEEAAARLEELLGLQPDNLDAIWGLERLYDPVRPAELARVLRLHAAREQDSQEKSRLLLRSGTLLAELGDEQQAIDALDEAFTADPGNRDVFTTLETFLFEHDRFPELMELYDRAIYFVEEQGGRAYRPVDLWSRRGQLLVKHLAQPDEAVASYLKALEYDPKSESAMKMLESIFLQRQDWLGLVHAYEHRANLVVSNELFRLESLREAARLARSRLPERPEEALRIWEEVYRLDPIDEEALDNLEELYAQERQFEKLVSLIEHRSALVAQDDVRLGLHLRAAEICERELEDPERAARAYESIRAIEAHHEQALKALARIYEATSRWDRCMEVLQDLVIMEADPDERSLLYFKCGSIMESRFSDDEQAIHYYQAALREAAGCLPAVHGLRDLYLRREDWNKALETLDLEFQLWEEKHEQAGILTRMAEIRLHHLKDARKAIEQLEDALAIDPECQAAALTLFDLCFERRDQARANELAELLVPRMAKEGDPEQRSRFYNRRGQLLAAAGKVPEAAESLVVALELRPRNLEALDWLIALCRRAPEAYDFASIFRELEQVYRREGDQAAVGHVLVAAGALSEIAGDAEVALDRYREAINAAPQDLAPVASLAELLVKLRRAGEAVDVLRELATRAVDPTLKRRTLLRLGDLYADVMLQPEEASAVFLEVLATDPGNADAASRLAQEYLLLGRLDEAQRVARALCERAASDGSGTRELSRHTHYLGVILLRRGDSAGALVELRRALQLDATNGPAAIALARQLILSGDRPGAEQLLLSTLKRLGDQTTAAALDLRRSLAGLYLGAGEAGAAVDCYTAIVEEGGKAEDRLALAEILAGQPSGATRAREELGRVLAVESTNLHALRLLSQIQEERGELDRSLQTLRVIDLLGGADDQSTAKLNALRRVASFKLNGVLDEELRRKLVPAPRDLRVAQLWQTLHEPLEKLFGQEQPPGVLPLEQVASPQLRQLCDFCLRLHGIAPLVQVAEEVPGGALAIAEGAPGRVVLDKLFLARPLPEVAFMLGRSLEYLRSGHALLSRLAFDDRLLLAELLAGMLSGESNDLVQEFRRGLPRRVTKLMEEIAERYRAELPRAEAEQPKRWLADVDRAAASLGLLTCDDIAAALRMVAQLGSQEVLTDGGGIAVQYIPDGPELVQIYLSDAYIAVRRALTTS
jgi:tetratricopeptide (TPR) repeat protein